MLLDIYRNELNGRVLLVGDVHNQGRAFVALLKLAQVTPEDLVILLGDLVDRGPDLATLVGPALAPNVRWILGNHDAWLLDNLRHTPVQQLAYYPLLLQYTQVWPHWQEAAGGYVSERDDVALWYERYGRPTLMGLSQLPLELSCQFLRKMANAPVLMNIWNQPVAMKPDWMLVHGCLPPGDPEPWLGAWLDQPRKVDTCLWRGFPVHEEDARPGVRVAVGHVPVTSIRQHGDYWLCDTGASKDFNRLSMLDIDSLQTWTVECDEPAC